MRFVGQDIKFQGECTDRIDAITAVDRLFQGHFGAEEESKTALIFKKYPTTQNENSEAIILLVVDIRSTFKRAVRATNF